MTKTSFYGDTPNYATSLPTQNDTNTKPVTGNAPAPTSFYRNGGTYTTTLPVQYDPNTQPVAGNTKAPTSFYGSTANYAAGFPAQGNSNTQPVTGNTGAPSSFYHNGGNYAEANPVASANSASAAAASATAAAASAASAAASVIAIGSTALLPANNLSDLGNLTTAKTNLGINNVNNTSDANKPVSTAQAAADALVASNASAGWIAADTVVTNATNTALALKANLASPTFTGTPAAPTATVGTNTTQLATTAFVLANGTTLGSSTPLMNGVAAAGSSTSAAHADHVHPTDTSLAPLASPTLTGTPVAPTATPGTNTTQLATTAFVLSNATGVTPRGFNGTIAASVSANALTFTLKSKTGGTPSASDPVTYTVADGAGGYTTLTVTSAVSVTIPASTTLGTANAAPFRFWVALFNDAGTPRLAVKNFLKTASPSANIGAANENAAANASTTAAVSTWYSPSAAITSKFWRFVAYATYESGLTTAGTYASAPTNVVLVDDSTPRPGTVIQVSTDRTAATPSASVSSTYSGGLTSSITLTSAANAVEVGFTGYCYFRSGAVNAQANISIQRNGTTIFTNTAYANASTDIIFPMANTGIDFPLTASCSYTLSIAQLTSGLYQFALSNLTAKEIMT